MKVIGMKRSMRTSKKTGNTYEAANIYCTYPLSGGVGEACEALFVKADIVPPSLGIGEEIRVLYNRYGNVEAIEVM